MRRDHIEYEKQIKMAKIHNYEQMQRLLYYKLKCMLYLMLIFYFSVFIFKSTM